MTDKARKAYEKIKDTLGAEVKSLNPEEYQDVLEEVITECEGRLDALAEEQGED